MGFTTENNELFSGSERVDEDTYWIVYRSIAFGEDGMPDNVTHYTSLTIVIIRS